MAKRLLSVLLTFLMIVPFILPHSTASGDVYVAVNNAMLPITDAMPIRSDGIWYVDYRCFTDSELSVNASYNEDSLTLALYTWDYTLAFDMAAGTATNIRTDNTYRRWAFHSNGTIYVPAQFVASQLGMTYSFISSVNVIRIKTNNTVRDNVFAYIAKDEIPNLIERYNLEKAQQEEAQNNQQTAQPAVDPTDTEEEKDPVTVYLTFDVGNNTDCEQILKVLRRFNAKATFFVFGSAILQKDDTIRRISIDGHSLGISAMGGAAAFLQSVDSMKGDLSATNDLLFDACYTKSRLVRIPGSSTKLSDAQADALIESGYRYWDWDIDASSMTIRRFRSAIESKSSPVVIRFDASENSIRNLTSILSYLNENNHKTETISILTTPRNARRDVR